MLKKYTMTIAVLILAVVLTACGGKEESQEGKQPDQDSGFYDPVDISDEEKVAEDKVVAVVNGQDVTGEAYNLVYAQLKQQASQTGQQIHEDEIKTLTMESLVDRELLMQEAKEEGIEISDQEAEKEFKTIKSESQENLKNILKQYHMSEEGFINQLKFELTLNAFKEKTIDIDVSDDEVKEIYEEAKEENEEMPELAEIEDQLRMNIEEQKTNEALEEKIAKIREKAEIENNMES